MSRPEGTNNFGWRGLLENAFSAVIKVFTFN